MNPIARKGDHSLLLISKLYFFPKTHRADKSKWPIVLDIGSPVYNLDKCLKNNSKI